jgi:hypothetical protein
LTSVNVPVLSGFRLPSTATVSIANRSRIVGRTVALLSSGDDGGRRHVQVNTRTAPADKLRFSGAVRRTCVLSVGGPDL